MFDMTNTDDADHLLPLSVFDISCKTFYSSNKKRHCRLKAKRGTQISSIIAEITLCLTTVNLSEVRVWPIKWQRRFFFVFIIALQFL